MMDMTVSYALTETLERPAWLDNALTEVPMDSQALRVQARESLARVFDEIAARDNGRRPLYIPAECPAVVWQCDDNNPFWGEYSPWIYTERRNRSMHAEMQGPVVGWFQGAIDPRIETASPIYHPEDKSFGVSQTEAYFFFRVRFVKTRARMVKSKLVDERGEQLMVEDVIESAKPPRAVVTVGCTL